MDFKALARKYNDISLIKRIVAGLAVGAVLGIAFPNAEAVGLLGTLFVSALKAVAPVLVFFLVTSALANAKAAGSMRTVVVLYLVSTFAAALVAVGASYLFPTELTLAAPAEAQGTPSGIGEVLGTLVSNMVANPVDALANANYLGILVWAVVLGIALRAASGTVKDVFASVSDAVSTVVRWVIALAPFGVLGLVYSTVSQNGLDVFAEYGRLLLVLVGCMLFIALVANPLIVFACVRANPYLVLRCLKDSGVTAFFTRSSAANIPVNMELCRKLGLDKDNSAASACGASGVAGGSLLLIPLACSLFGIDGDVSLQVVAIGFIIGVVQDSCETALNSSSDVLFTAAAEYRQRRLEGRSFRLGRDAFDENELA